MELDVASYRRVAERWASKEEDINPSMAAVLMLQMCSELERLQKADYEFQEKLADGITDAFIERRWIPVGERLPEDGQRVLCYDPCICEDDWIARVAFIGGKFVGESSDGQPMYDYDPTHWMPLPEPPR